MNAYDVKFWRTAQDPAGAKDQPDAHFKIEAESDAVAITEGQARCDFEPAWFALRRDR